MGLGCSKPDETVTFTYFPLKARGFPILLALELGKVEYNPVIVQMDDWPKMKESGQCPFGYLPLFEFPDGTKINETNGCLVAAGIRAGKCGNSESAVALSAMLACKSAEVFTEIAKSHPMFFNKDQWTEERTESLKKFQSGPLEKYLAEFEALCNDSGKFTQEGDTIGELFVFSNLYHLADSEHLPKLPPKLQKFYDRLLAIPAVKNCCEDKTRMGVLANPVVKSSDLSHTPVIKSHTPVVESSDPSHTIYYHTACKGFYGRAWSSLAMLKHAEKPFTVLSPDECPSGSGFAPPMIRFPAGHTIAQTNVLTALVGKDCGLAPPDFHGEVQAKQIVADAGDLQQEIFQDKPAERVNKWLTYVENKCKGPYFLGENPTYADFGMYGPLAVIGLKQSKGKLEGVVITPKLKDWFEKMNKIPAVKELNESNIPLLPDTLL